MIRKIIVWLKRATGIGYRPYPPLGEMIDQEKADDMDYRARVLCRRVDQVEKILAGEEYGR